VSATRLLEQVDIGPGGTGRYNFSAAFTFMTTLPRKRVVSPLRHRIAQLSGQHANIGNLLKEGAGWGQPAHINEMYRLWLAGVDATIGWTEDLVKRLESGRSQT
jgi:hypothetical protein